MATTRRWKRTKIYHVSARTVTVEYPNSIKIQYRETRGGEDLFIRVDAKPLKTIENEQERKASTNGPQG